MPVATINPGETLSMLSDRILGDPLRFPELLDLNPDLDVFSELTQDIEVEIPEPSQILRFAQPQLTRISRAIGGTGRFLSQAERQLNVLSDRLPPQLQGYAREALSVVGEINGVLGEVEQVAGDRIEDELRQYDGQLTSLVQWVLAKR